MTGIFIAAAFLALLGIGAYSEFAGKSKARRLKRKRPRPANDPSRPRLAVPGRRNRHAATLQFQFDDGGRRAAGHKGQTGDCVVRARAISPTLP